VDHGLAGQWESPKRERDHVFKEKERTDREHEIDKRFKELETKICD
jgi:hypothetical protein